MDNACYWFRMGDFITVVAHSFTTDTLFDRLDFDRSSVSLPTIGTIQFFSPTYPVHFVISFYPGTLGGSRGASIGSGRGFRLRFPLASRAPSKFPLLPVSAEPTENWKNSPFVVLLPATIQRLDS